jgi:hypothetical protein
MSIFNGPEALLKRQLGTSLGRASNDLSELIKLAISLKDQYSGLPLEPGDVDPSIARQMRLEEYKADAILLTALVEKYAQPTRKP